MRYFKQEYFNKCIEFLKGKPETIETQQELYKFIHEDCRMLPDWNQVTTKNMCIYSKVYLTSNNLNTAIWNGKFDQFFRILMK